MKQTAFTIIELLVTLAIIVIIAVFIVPNLISVRLKSRDINRVSNIKTIQSALALYYADEGIYPDSLPIGSSLVGITSNKTYLKKIPSNPNPIDGACGSLTEFNYNLLENKQSYSLVFCLGGQVGRIGPNICAASPSDICDNNSYFSCDDSRATCASNQPLGCHCGGGTVIDSTVLETIVAASPDGGYENNDKKWKTSILDDAGSFSNTNGEINHNLIICNDSDQSGCSSHPAFEFCQQLVLDGYSDWYLPARDEMCKLVKASSLCENTAPGVGCDNACSITDATDRITGLSTFAYWTSTEASISNAWVMGLNAPITPHIYNMMSTAKNTGASTKIRCIRRD